MGRKRKRTKKKGKLHWGDAGTHETRGGSVFFFEEVRRRGRGSLSFFKDRLDGSVEHVATSCRLIRALSREKGEVRRSVGDARGRGVEGEAMLRDTVEEIRIDVQLHPCILSFCASFFFPFFFCIIQVLWKFVQRLVGRRLSRSMFRRFFIFISKVRKFKSCEYGGMEREKKKSDIARSAV